MSTNSTQSISLIRSHAEKLGTSIHTLIKKLRQSDSLPYLAAYFVLSLLSWILTNKASAVASDWVGPVLYGDFSVALRLSHNLAHLFVMGQEATLLMFLSKYHNNPEKQSGLVRWILKSTFIKTLLLLSITTIVLFYLESTPYSIARNYWAAFLAMPFVVICGIFERFFLYLKSFFTSFLPRGIYQPLIFILIIYAIENITNPSPLAALYTYAIAFFISSAIYGIYGYFSGFTLSNNSNYDDKRIWQQTGLFYTFSTLIIKSTPSIALYFLERLGNSEVSVGHFAALCNLIYGFHLLTKPFDSYLKPSIAELYSKGHVAQLQEKVNYINKIRWGVILGLLITILIGGKFMLSQYGPTFKDVYAPFMLLSSFCFLQYLGQPAHELLNYTGYQKHLSVIMAIQFFAIASLSQLLIPSLDIWGAVIAQGLPCVLATLASAHTLRKHTKIKAYFFF